jgi:hypothetical protein
MGRKNVPNGRASPVLPKDEVAFEIYLDRRGLAD